MTLKVGVIGAGSLGTAISQTISENVNQLLLHVRKQDLCDDINNTGYNTHYYPSQKLNENIKATTDLNDLSDCDIIFLAIPSSAFRDTLKNLKDVISDDTILVTTAKGIEYPSLKSMGDLISEYFNENYVALSGPNFASEIMLNQPTVTNIASRNPENSLKVKEVLSTKLFKVKIIESVGGFSDTVHEYCGFGDLILTSTSSESRNHTLGILYGQRLIIDEAASGIVFEGKNSIRAVKDICDNNNVHSDIVDFVYDVIIERMTPIKAFNILWDKIE